MPRYKCSSAFLGIVFTARIAFSKRSWPYLVAAAVPWLLCTGQRSVTRLAALAAHKRSLSGYYRFLSDGKWRLFVLRRTLFDLIVRTFKLTALTLVLDDTLSPKWGRHIFGTGSFFDHTARPRAGYIWGHDWVLLAVVVQAGAVGWVALPFWIVLYRPKERCPADLFRTRHQLAGEALRAVREWFPGAITLLADGAYNNRSILAPATQLGIVLISRLRGDARFRRPHPPRQPKGKRGRKPKRGPRLPSIKRLAQDLRSFRRQQVSIYGKTLKLWVRELVVYWPPAQTVVKVVISRESRRGGRIAYLLSTDLNRTGVQVVESFAQRWTIEQLFLVLKNHLGLDSAEVRKERSVTRHAALCVAVAVWLEVWAHHHCPRLRGRSFARKLGALRSQTIAQTIFASGPRGNRAREIAAAFGNLYATATSAA